MITEESFVGGDRVCSNEEDCEAACPVIVVEVVVAFQNFQEPKGSGGDGSLAESDWTQLTGIMDAGSPASRNQIRLVKRELDQSVVAEETVSGVSEVCFQIGVSHAVVHIDEAMRTMRGAKQLHGVTVGARPGIVDDARSEKCLTRERVPILELVKPGRAIFALSSQILIQNHDNFLVIISPRPGG